MSSTNISSLLARRRLNFELKHDRFWAVARIVGLSMADAVSEPHALPDAVLDGELRESLQVDGRDVRSLPLLERRRALYAAMPATAGIKIIEHIETHGTPLFHAIAADDHEGIVAKRAEAPYRAGPRDDWLMVKNRDYSQRAAVEWRE